VVSGVDPSQNQICQKCLNPEELFFSSVVQKTNHFEENNFGQKSIFWTIVVDESA
jgi:hypothetical protein